MKPSHLNSRSRPPSSRRKPKARRSEITVRVRAKTKTKIKSKRKPKTRVNAEKKSSSLGCYVFILILLAGVGYYAYVHKDQLIEKWNLSQYFESKKEVETFIPDPVTYEKLKSDLAYDRKILKARFLNATSAQAQNQVLNEARELLEHTMPKMMRCWLGHPWDFNGTATVPGEGKVACGFFVSVIMRDAGFKVERIRLAQQPSQRIIKTFLPMRKDLWINGGLPYDEYAGKLESKYEGINIVGLDNHVAFVVVDNGEMRFIHSGGLQRCVVDEAKPDAHSLEVSNYRVIGNFTRNRNCLQKWILGDAFPTAR